MHGSVSALQGGSSNRTLNNPRDGRSVALISTLLVALAVLLWAGVSSGGPAPGPERALSEARAEQPLAFEANGGRFPAQISHIARSESGTVAVTDRGIAFSAAAGGGEADSIRLGFPGADLGALQTRGELPGVVNDLRGSREQWKRGIPTFESLRHREIFPGVQLDLYGNAGALEYDFRLAPGVDPGVLGVRIHGADSLRLTPGGELVARTGQARFVQQAPVAFQPADPAAGLGRSAVESSFTLDGNRLGFELGSFDRARPLVIDPVTLAYSTYLGGSAEDLVTDLTADQGGALYAFGETLSDDFNRLGEIQGYSADRDTFVSKIARSGSLVYSTYLGGTGREIAQAIEVGPDGSAYVTGLTTSADFPTAAAAQPLLAGEVDAFVSRLAPDGGSLLYSTFFGGSDADSGAGLSVGVDGSAYVGGRTSSDDLPLVSELQQHHTGNDGFIAKFSAAGALQRSTYLGGPANDLIWAIEADDAGAVYFAGESNGAGFPTVNPYEGASGSSDVVVGKLAPSGAALEYSTYLGGSGSDRPAGISVDPDGSAFVVGETISTNFDTHTPIQAGYGGSKDAFVTKFTPDGAGLEYSTYLGGSQEDYGADIEVDGRGAAYITGSTASSSFPTSRAIQPYRQAADAFVAELAPDGSRLAFSTHLGGQTIDRGLGIALSGKDTVHVGGYTHSTDFPTVSPIEGYSGNPAGDGFIATIDSSLPETSVDSGPANGAFVSNPSPSFEFSSDRGEATFECRIDGGEWGPCSSPLATGPFADGVHSFEVRALHGGDRDPSPAARTFTVDTLAPDTTIEQGPSGTTGDRTPAFEFGASEPTSGYQCRVDDGPFAPCSGPGARHTTAPLGEGPHIFRVRAVDRAGNTDFSPAERAFSVDSTPPDTVITRGPKARKGTTKRTATFKFSASESASSFECRLDKAPFKVCSSPLRLKRIKPGQHKFQTRATDLYGNTDPTPAKLTWTVKKKKRR